MTDMSDLHIKTTVTTNTLMKRVKN